MAQSTTLVIVGNVTAGSSKGPYGGAIVAAHLSGARKPIGETITDQLGQFRIVLEVGRHVGLSQGETISFAVRTSRKSKPMFVSNPVALAKSAKGRVKLHVPASALASIRQDPKIRLLVDNYAARELEIGQTISLVSSGLYPSAQFEIKLSLDGSEPLTQTIISNPFGAIELATILPQFGLWEFDSERTLTVGEALERFGGQTLAWELLYGKQPLARGKLAVSRELSRPLAFISDQEGRLQNAVQHDRDLLFLTTA
jgi:hypothetical protein